MKRKNLLMFTGFMLAAFTHLALANLDQIVQKTGKDAVMGVVVKDVLTGRIIYQHNANHLFIPASSLKVYTGAAALVMLGPNFHFDTNLYTDASSAPLGVLKGNIYVVFSGDPTLINSDIVELVKVLKMKGIASIQGNVVLVYPNYTKEKYPPGGSERDYTHPYGAPVTPVIIDQNAVTFTIHSTGSGQLAQVNSSEPSGRMRIVNKLYTKKAGVRSCSLGYHLDGNNQLEVRGCISPRSEPYIERIAINNPAVYAEGVVAEALKYWNINVQGNIGSGQMPAQAKLLNTHSSKALPAILADTLKPSNNVFANALYLKVGLVYGRQMATWQSSGLAVKQILEKYVGVPLSTATFVDGAGLSRQNRVTPMQTATLLANMDTKFRVSEDYVAAFPVPGQKGTLIHRHIGSPAMQSHIHAKTGTMKGIVGLVGYLPSANRHALVFAIMTNSASNQVYLSDRVYLSLWKYRELEDEICRYLMNANV